MRLSRVSLLPVGLLMVACSTTPGHRAGSPAVVLATEGSVSKAEAILTPSSASLVSGRLLLAAESGGVRISGTLGGLPAAFPVGFHIHETGNCSAVDGSSAGPHFNPQGHPHGGPHLSARHLGDMNNLLPGADGRVAVDLVVANVVMGGGAVNDILARALVVHAQPDDHHSQPAGNAGARIACGVIRPMS